MNQTKGTLLLLLAAIVWGVAFVAQSMAADHVGTFTFNSMRNIVAVIVMTVIINVKEHMQKRSAVISGSAAPKPLAANDHKKIVLAGIACGIALFAADAFQQGGITAYPAEAAASGRAGFITATYVVMVALVTWIMTKKMRISLFNSIVVCIAGMYFLCLSGGISGIYLGDILVLGSAVGYTAHILVIDRYTDLDSFRLTRMQFAVAGTLATIAMLVFETPRLEDISQAALAILYAGMISSCVGYTLQTVGQKDSDPAVGAVVMSLESVFAVLAGWLFLNEYLTPQELFGCVLVFAAVIIAQVPDIAKGIKARKIAKELKKTL